MTESTLALIAFAMFVITLAGLGLVRVAPMLPVEDYKLDDYETAYLFGGETRAKEMAFFVLLRDGCIKGDDDGNFSSRYAAVPIEFNDRPEIERELLQKIIANKGVRAVGLRQVPVAAVEKIDRRLERKRLMLSKQRADLCALFARLPLGFLSLWALKISVDGLIQNHVPITSIAITLACWIALSLLNRHLSPRTEAGEKLYHHLRDSLRPSDSRDHDRLQALQNELLFKGLTSMVGAAILPSTLEARRSSAV